MRVIKVVQFVAMTYAAYAIFATICLQFPIYEDTPWMYGRVQSLIFKGAVIAFVAMLVCYLAARRITHRRS